MDSAISRLRDDVADLVLESLKRRETEAKRRRKEESARGAEQAAQAFIRDQEARKPDRRVMA